MSKDMKGKDDHEKYYTKFSGEDAENTWWEYSLKTKAYAEKNKWTSALEKDIVNPTTKEQKAAEAAGRESNNVNSHINAVNSRVRFEPGMQLPKKKKRR